MASVQTVNKFMANNAVTGYVPGDISTASEIGWVDMSDYEGIVVKVNAVNLTGVGVDEFSIVANSESDGGGTDATVDSHAVASAPDAAGDYLFLEVSAEQIRAVETAATGQLRYVTAKIGTANASDRVEVTYIRYGARFAKDGLTADVVAA